MADLELINHDSAAADLRIFDYLVYAAALLGPDFNFHDLVTFRSNCIAFKFKRVLTKDSIKPGLPLRWRFEVFVSVEYPYKLIQRRLDSLWISINTR